jgi:RNA polymerase sigma-70 factor (ECF subfamily)
MTEQINIEDIALIRQLNAGDDAAFRSLYYKYYALLLNTANRYVNDPYTAEDLVQGIFEKIWQDRDSFNVHTSLKSYLRMTAVNQSINYIKRQKKIVFNGPDEWIALTTDPAEADIQIEKNEMDEALRKAIDSLPEKCRIVFLLSRFEKFSHKEIAEQLDISTKTIENQITKAIKVIREIIIKYKELSALVIFCINMFLVK